jgi:DNA-directed RNA polymerase subunit M/transcription elongation factor TFIIS
MRTDHCPHCDAPLAAEADAKERCPYCGKQLSSQTIADAVAIKKPAEIPTLQEYVEPPRERPRRPAEHRRNGSGPRCPECGSTYLSSGPWPWYLGTIGAMLCRAMVCDDCGHEFDARKPHANLAKRKRNLAILINGIGLLGILAVIGGLALWIWWVVNKW